MSEERCIKEIKKQYSKSHYSCALKLANNCLNNYKDNAEIYVLRGYIYNKLNKYKQAHSDANRALTLQNSSASALWLQQEILLSQGDYKKALTILDNIEKVTPTALMYYDRGYVKFLTKDYSGAVKDFNSSIKGSKKPPFKLFFLFRGSSYMQLGEYGKAIKDFNRLICRYPNEPVFYALRARCYLQTKDLENAVLDIFTSSALYSTIVPEDNNKSYKDNIAALTVLAKHFNTPEKIQKAHFFSEIFTKFAAFDYNDLSKIYIFYITPEIWFKLDYCDKILLFQQAVFYAMFQEFIKGNQPFYPDFINKIKIQSFKTGLDLMSIEKNKGRKQFVFPNVTLQNISENAVVVKKEDK